MYPLGAFVVADVDSFGSSGAEVEYDPKRSFDLDGLFKVDTNPFGVSSFEQSIR